MTKSRLGKSVGVCSLTQFDCLHFWDAIVIRPCLQSIANLLTSVWPPLNSDPYTSAILLACSEIIHYQVNNINLDFNIYSDFNKNGEKHETWCQPCNEPQDKVLIKLGPIVFEGFVQHLGKFAYCRNLYCHMTRYIPFNYQGPLFWEPGARDASVTSTLQDSYFFKANAETVLHSRCTCRVEWFQKCMILSYSHHQNNTFVK